MDLEKWAEVNQVDMGVVRMNHANLNKLSIGKLFGMKRAEFGSGDFKKLVEYVLDKRGVYRRGV